VKDYVAAGREHDQAKINELTASIKPGDRPSIIAASDDALTGVERDVLYGLANLSTDPSSIAHFRQRCPVPTGGESDEELLRLRDELRLLWAGNNEPDGSKREDLVKYWVGGPRSLSDPGKWHVFWQLGVFRPNTNFFRGVLAWAYCRHMAALKTCANPDCPAPYFIATRRTQIYCSETDECARFAARKTARKYWHAKGKRKSKKKEATR
jgi:hypothetical protein